MKNKIIWQGVRRPLADQHKVIMKINGSEFGGNLPLYLDEENHSPTGFEWGYLGSGPSQLAYAILRSYFVLVEKESISRAISRAKGHHARFKQDFVAKWRGDEWEINSEQVSFWLDTQKEDWKEGWV